MSKSNELKQLMKEGEEREKRELEILQVGQEVKDTMKTPGFERFSKWLNDEKEALKEAIFEVEEDSPERISHETMRIKFQKRTLEKVEDWFKQKVANLEEVLDNNPKLAEEIDGKENSSTTSKNA